MILVSGYIKNTSGQPIPSASIQVIDGNFDYTGEGTAANSDGFFSLYVNELLSPYGLSISSVGYKPTVVRLSSFVNLSVITLATNVVDLPPVVVTSGSDNNKYLWLIALAGGAFILLNDDKKGRRVNGTGKVDTNTVLLVGGGLVGLVVINKILVSLGLGTGPGGHNVNNELTDPGSEWKPTYYKSLPPGTQYYTLTPTGGAMFSKQIYDAFTLFKDNFDQIMGVFNQLQTKTQVSVLADYFQQKYDRDLLTFLKDGGGVLPWDGLSDAQFYTLTTYVNNLPATWP
jgi:hypothetical protein